MLDVMSIILPLVSVALIVYYRYTDSRSVTVKALQDYFKQSEKHLELMLQKKEKELNDRVINADIVRDKMHRSIAAVKDLLEQCDSDIARGGEIFSALREETGSLQQELEEYRQLRKEFKGIEESVASILDIKKQSLDGTAELQDFRNKLAAFSDDYDKMTGDIRAAARAELEDFFQNMQHDLSAYIAQSRQHLSDKSIEINNQIQDLGTASGSLAEQIKSFKDYARDSIEQLKRECDDDLDIAKASSEAKIADIYDKWESLRKKTEYDTELLQDTFTQQKDYFERVELSLRSDIESFNKTIENMSDGYQENFELKVQESMHEFENRINEISLNIEKKGASVIDEVAGSASDQMQAMDEKLSKLHSAFSEQEQSTSDSIKALNTKIQENFAIAEKELNTGLEELQTKVENVKQLSENVLKDAESQIEHKIQNIEEEFKSKAKDNMARLEDSFKESNQERVTQSINDITESLGQEFTERYQKSMDDILQKSEHLEDSVNSKILFLDELDKRLDAISDRFETERDAVITMANELESSRHSATDMIIEQVNESMMGAQEKIYEYIDGALEGEKQKITDSHSMWQDRYEAAVQKARDEYSDIRKNIEKLEGSLNMIEDNAAVSIKRESDRLVNETKYKIEDFKSDMSDTIRSSKDEFADLVKTTRDDLKKLREDLWAQEREIHQKADKDLDRLTAKVKDAEKQFQDFSKKAEQLDQVGDLLRRLDQQYSDTNTLKTEVENTYAKLKDSESEGRAAAEDIQSKIEELHTSSAEAVRIQEGFVEVLNDARNMPVIFESLASEKERVQEISAMLEENLSKLNDINGLADNLETRREMVETMLESLEKSEQGVTLINENTAAIETRVREMDDSAREIQGQLESLKADMNTLAGDQTEIGSAVAKLNNLEHMITHIEQEFKRLEKMRDWIAKYSNELEKNKPASDSSEEDKKIINLYYNKDWSIDEISKHLGISTAYIDITLERYKNRS